MLKPRHGALRDAEIKGSQLFNKMQTKKRSPLVLRRRELEQDRFRGCNLKRDLPGADHKLAQVARLVQQIVRALAVRLCEQLPPHRTYNH